MLDQEVLLQLQKYNFDLLARQEPSGRRRLRYMALAHIKGRKSTSETAEQVWQQLRDRSLANRCYEDYEQIVDACCDAWNKFTQIPGAIR
jgi:hypothetical protein